MSQTSGNSLDSMLEGVRAMSGWVFTQQRPLKSEGPPCFPARSACALLSGSKAGIVSRHWTLQPGSSQCRNGVAC